MKIVEYNEGLAKKLINELEVFGYESEHKEDMQEITIKLTDGNIIQIDLLEGKTYCVSINMLQVGDGEEEGYDETLHDDIYSETVVPKRRQEFLEIRKRSKGMTLAEVMGL